MVKVRRRTEAGEAPRWQDATTENRGPRRAWFARSGGNIGQYLREEQRSQHRGPQRGSRVGVERGCIAGRMQPDFYHGLLRACSHFSDTLLERPHFPVSVVE